MKIRILAPEATLGETKYRSGDTVAVDPGQAREAARLIRSGYAIVENPGQGQKVADLKATLDRAGVAYTHNAKKDELEAAVAALPPEVIANTEEA